MEKGCPLIQALRRLVGRWLDDLAGPAAYRGIVVADTHCHWRFLTSHWRLNANGRNAS